MRWRLRLQINCKLRDGWQHRDVSEWLLTQRADCDLPELLLKTGDPYALIWRRSSRDEDMVHENCRATISRWFRGAYQDWLASQPKPYVPPPDTPRTVKKAFAALREELKGNPRARILLRRLYDAVCLAWPDHDQWNSIRCDRPKRPR